MMASESSMNSFETTHILNLPSRLSFSSAMFDQFISVSQAFYMLERKK